MFVEKIAEIKEKIESDIKGYKEDIAKVDVWYNLIKLKMEENK